MADHSSGFGDKAWAMAHGEELSLGEPPAVGIGSTLPLSTGETKAGGTIAG